MVRGYVKGGKDYNPVGWLGAWFGRSVPKERSDRMNVNPGQNRLPS